MAAQKSPSASAHRIPRIPPIGPHSTPFRSTGRRRRTDISVWVLSAIALLVVAAPVGWILASIVGQAVLDWHWSVLSTPSVGTSGGLSNAIVGSAVIAGSVLVCAGVAGIAAGIYIAEYAPPAKASFLRGASEILSGVPSIVLGYVGYTTLVVSFHWGFSLAAATATLTVLVLPYIVKATEVALGQVPTSYREAAEALGFPPFRVLRAAVLRPAIPGIATGLIVAVAIALGETAPLLYTAGWSDRMPSLQPVHAPIAYLPYAVWTFYNEPYPSAHALSHDAALLLILFVLLLIVVSRVVVLTSQRHAPTARAKRGNSLRPR